VESEIEIKAAASGRVKIRVNRREIKGCRRAAAGEEAGRGTGKGMHMAGSDGRQRAINTVVVMA